MTCLLMINHKGRGRIIPGELRVQWLGSLLCMCYVNLGAGGKVSWVLVTTARTMSTSIGSERRHLRCSHGPGFMPGISCACVE